MPILFYAPKYKVRCAADRRTGRRGFKPLSLSGNGLPNVCDRDPVDSPASLVWLSDLQTDGSF